LTVTVTPTSGTGPGGATAGADFAGAPQTLTFGGGQTSATVNIALSSDNLVEGHETFAVALGGATGGLTVGAPAYAAVGIVDANGTDVQQFINGVYLKELGRQVDQGTPAGGLEFWTNFLGPSPTQEQKIAFIRFLESTAEARTAEAGRLFQRYLGRAANPAEAAAGAAALAAGAAPDQLAVSLLVSTEFLERAGGTAAGFADQVFLAALGRPRGAGELLPAGFDANDLMQRINYALAVVTSPEAERFKITQVYQRDLMVTVPESDSGVIFWANLLQRGVPEEVVRADILSFLQPVR
jgi:hypothetical protein